MKKILLACLVAVSFAQVEAQVITLNQFVSGINTPADIAFAPGDDRMYVVQQRGRIRIVNTNGTITGTDFINLTSSVSQSGNEQGLLGLAFHPDYAANGYFYVNYTRSSNGNTRISRFTRDSGNPDIGDPSSEVVLMEIYQPYSNHNGGCMKFGTDGYLYIGMGDGGDGGDPGNRSQNPDSLLGKMLRIAVDGPGYTVPLSNPYYANSDTLPEIWALGVRNPWRFSFDKLTGDLWMGDVGQGAREEVNFQPVSSMGGENYGWRCYEGNNTFNTSGCQPQAFYDAPAGTYTHGGGRCSVTGGFVYRGGEYGDLYGKYLYVDYCSGDFFVTAPDGLGGWTTTMLNDGGHNIVSFGENHQGDLYVAAADNGTIYRVGSTGTVPAASIYGENGATAICNGGSLLLSTPNVAGYGYQWQLNGINIGGATTSTHLAAVTGDYTVNVTNLNAFSATSPIFTVTASSSPAALLTAPSAVCQNDAPVLITGLPAGGVYSGTGAGTGIFYPSVAGTGTFEVYYSLTNAEGCVGTDTATIVVVPVPAVTITNAETLACLDNGTVTLTGNPAGGTFTGTGVTGTSFDPLAAGVGMHPVIYSYSDGTCANSDTLTFEVADCDVGVNGPGAFQQLRIYPNPSDEFIMLEISLVQTGAVEAKLFTTDGRLVSTRIFNGADGANTFTMDVSLLPAGTYLLALQAQGETSNRMIIVK